MHDVAIIGTGPAGLAAALNFQLHNKKMLWFGSKELSSKVGKAHMIANYPGNSMISGEELNQQFQKQIAQRQLEIQDAVVTSIMPYQNGFMILANNEVYQAKSILLAIGSHNGRTIEGEQTFLGLGVSYCATCDGFLYQQKTIAVYCGAKRFEHEVAYLASLAKKVYVFAPYQEFGVEKENVERMPFTLKRIVGEKKVQKVVDWKENEYEVDGCFILKEAIAPSSLISGLQMEEQHIVVNRRMETNIKGVYAAGDCTGAPYQIAKAVGEGNVAALQIYDYLAE